jgi:hypothetical protein
LLDGSHFLPLPLSHHQWATYYLSSPVFCDVSFVSYLFVGNSLILFHQEGTQYSMIRDIARWFGTLLDGSGYCSTVLDIARWFWTLLDGSHFLIGQ